MSDHVTKHRLNEKFDFTNKSISEIVWCNCQLVKGRHAIIPSYKNLTLQRVNTINYPPSPLTYQSQANIPQVFHLKPPTLFGLQTLDHLTHKILLPTKSYYFLSPLLKGTAYKVGSLFPHLNKQYQKNEIKDKNATQNRVQKDNSTIQNDILISSGLKSLTKRSNESFSGFQFAAICFH